MIVRAAGLVFLLPFLLIPQQPMGEIRGTIVNDLKGVPLHSAAIELRGEGLRRIVQTTGEGYRITAVPAGAYDLTISGSFLVRTIIRSVHLKAGETLVLPPIRPPHELMYDCARRLPVFFRLLDQTD